MTHADDLCRSQSTQDQRAASTLLAAPARETELSRARSTAGPNKVQSQFDRRLRRRKKGPSTGRALLFSTARAASPGPNKTNFPTRLLRTRSSIAFRAHSRGSANVPVSSSPAKLRRDFRICGEPDIDVAGPRRDRRISTKVRSDPNQTSAKRNLVTARHQAGWHNRSTTRER